MRKVYIIDDEKLIREGLTHYINWDKLGMEIVGSAGDGMTALEEITRLLPDIIISDIRLPELSGVKLLKELRERNIKCEFILISAYSDFDYAQEGIRYGAFDYILKPIDEDTLEETLQRCSNKLLSEQPCETQEPPEENAKNLSYKEKLVAQVTDYVQTHYQEEIKLEDAAEMINMSASHFGRLFKEITGENFSRYVYRIRMEKSKELICNSTYKIYEIAEMVGYTDISHFSKKFKEYFGYSPAQLR